MRRLIALTCGFALILMSVSSASAAVRFKAIRFDPPGKDVGSSSHLNKEWVKLKNTGRKAKDLTGWKLKDQGASHTFIFDGISLPGGDLLVLHTGKGSHRVSNGCGGRCSVHHYYWGLDGYVWNNDGDKAVLKKPSGTVADRCRYSGAGSTKRC